MGTSPLHAPEYRRFCEQLRRWREEAELSQRELAAKFGKHHSFIAKTETGQRRMDVLEFITWCRGVGLDPAKTIRQLEEHIG